MIKRENAVRWRVGCSQVHVSRVTSQKFMEFGGSLSSQEWTNYIQPRGTEASTSETVRKHETGDVYHENCFRFQDLSQLPYVCSSLSFPKAASMKILRFVDEYSRTRSRSSPISQLRCEPKRGEDQEIEEVMILRKRENRLNFWGHRGRRK